MPRFATLGPAGSNHDWVARRYIDFHALDAASVELFADFDAAFEALLNGTVDFVVQVAVHPSVAGTVARYRCRAHLVDTFISPSQPMAVLTRSDVEHPRSLGAQPATQAYVDTARWDEVIPEPTTIDVAEGLLSGRYDSGITLARFQVEHPQRLRIDETIGAVTDPWLVYATRTPGDGELIAWRDGPVRRLFPQSSSNRR